MYAILYLLSIYLTRFRQIPVDPCILHIPLLVPTFYMYALRIFLKGNIALSVLFHKCCIFLPGRHALMFLMQLLHCVCRDPHRGNAAGKADAAQRHDNPPRNPPNRDKGASARAAGRGRKRMHRNPHRGNAAGKADAAQRHDNAPRNPPNRDKGASARAAGRGRKRMHRNPHRGNAAGKADAAQRHDNPPRNPPNRDRCAAEAVASSGGDPPRRPPPEADAHRPARRPEENPAAG